MRTNSAAFAFLTLRSNPVVRANAAALALLAPSLEAVVYAKVTGGRTVSAVVLDLVVDADVRTLTRPAPAVSNMHNTRYTWDDLSKEPAHAPPFAVNAKNTPTTITAL